MSGRRGHQLLLVGSFLATIASVPLIQATLEFREDRTVQLLDLFRQAPTAENLRLFEDELETQSWFAQRLRPWMQYGRFLTLKDTGEKALRGREEWWFYRPGVRYLIEACESDADARAGPGPVVTAVVSFRDQLAARSVRLLIVPVPGKASVYPDMLTRRAGKVDPAVRVHTRRVIDDLTAAGVEVVDLYEAFARARAGASAADPRGLYLARDTHWTGGGVRLAAAAVASRIRRLGWAQAGPVNYETRPVTVERPGDVVRMLKTPQIERLFEPEEVRCEQVIHPRTGRPYQDRPHAAILVLGDSFLRIYERDEPGSAGFIAHLARALAQPVASIVNDGGASTLVRQELARKPHLLLGKTLVVLEFVERDIRFGMEGWQEVRLPDPASSGPSLGGPGQASSAGPRP